MEWRWNIFSNFKQMVDKMSRKTMKNLTENWFFSNIFCLIFFFQRILSGAKHLLHQERTAAAKHISDVKENGEESEHFEEEPNAKFWKNQTKNCFWNDFCRKNAKNRNGKWIVFSNFVRQFFLQLVTGNVLSEGFA